MSFKVGYSFVAKDQFTSVAKKIAEASQQIDEAVKKSNAQLCQLDKELNKTNKSFKNISSSINSVNSKINQNVKKADLGGKSFQRFGDRIKEATKKTVTFGEKLTKTSDFFGMQAYYQLMNVAFPMAIIAKLGMDYAESLESAKIQMDALFSGSKNYAKFQQQINMMAKNYAATTRFSAAQIMQVASIVSSMTGNMQAATKSVPVILKYSIATGQTKNISGAASQFLQGVLAGRLPKVNMLLTGGSAYERLNQALDRLNARYKNILIDDSKSAGAQLARLNNNLKAVFATIMTSLAPAFEYYGNILAKYIPKIETFIKNHKTLMVVLGKLAIGGIAFLGVLAGLGVVIGIISMPFQAFNAILKVSTILIGAFSVEMMPLTIGLIAVATAVTAIVLNFEKLKKVVESVWDKLKGFKERAKIDLTGFLSNKPIQGPSSLWMGIKHFFGGESLASEHKVHVNINIADKGNNVRSAHASHSGEGKISLNLGQNLVMP